MRRGTAVLLALLALVLTGCAGRSSSSGTSPLTGLPLGSGGGGPVLAVKVDNSPAARPWTGLEAADAVYVEPVEGGTTRLLAVFVSRRPASVGPVRSFRETDLGVLGAYGSPALVYSGSAPELAATLAAAPVVPLSPATAPDAFRRDDTRSAPDNLYADPAALDAAAAGAGGPRDVGFTFGPAPAGGTATASEDVTVGDTAVGLEWDAGDGRWAVSMDGEPAVTRDGARLQAATVLVQTVETEASSVTDVDGVASPRAETVGTGEARVLRDGQVFDASWSRPDAASPTTVTTAGGAELPFATGPLWVLLVPRA